jgi:hypothetical protein
MADNSASSARYYKPISKAKWCLLKHNKGLCRHCEERSNLSKAAQNSKDRRATARDDAVLLFLMVK